MRRAAIAAGAVLALPGAARAADVHLGATVAATAGYSNNPFAERRIDDDAGTGINTDNGRGTSSGFVAFDVSPQARIATERNTFTITGQAHVQDYFRRYPVTDSYRIGLDWRGRPAERLTTFAHVDLTSAVLGADDQYAVGSIIGPPVVGGTVPDTGLPTTGTPVANPIGSLPGVGVGTGPLISDIGLLGTRDRRRSVYGTAGGSYALSAHDTLDLSGFVDIARYGRFGGLSNYDGYGGTIGYSRQVSASFNAGVQGSGSRYAYGGTQGTTNVYSVEATASGRLSQYLTVDGALGVTFVSTDALGSRDRTSLSGNVDLCYKNSYDSACLQASRQARATGFNGAQYVTSVGANLQHRLDERSRVSLDAYYLSEGGLGGLRSVNGFQNRYLRFAATYDRDLRQRLSLLVSARYRKIFGGFGGQSADYGGQVGLSYKFGDLR